MRFSWGAVAALGVVVAVACKSSTGSGSGCQSTGANVIIQATDSKQFSPASQQIGQTQTVCWENTGTRETHSVTFADSSLDAALAPGYIALKGFGTIPGDFTYYCKYHVGMT